jgi:hypothetical protein
VTFPLYFIGDAHMKTTLAVCVLVGALAASVSGQMPKYGVTVTADKAIDYSKFKTYTWTRSQPSEIKSVDAQITAAVDRELAALGMTKAASGTGDVLVTYGSLTRTDVDVKAKPDAKGSLPMSKVGTLVVWLQDTKTRARLLQLRTDKPIDADDSKLEATINAAVKELFEQYPTRTAKK